MNISDTCVEGLPTISVLIPVYNDIFRVEACIESLANQASSPEFEVIVVDNGSSDGTYEFLKQYEPIDGLNLQITQCLTPGSYAARNHGLAIAKGEYIAFTDSDCIVSKYWLKTLYQGIQKEPEDTIIAGKMEFFPDPSKKTEQSAIDFENLFSMKQDENAKNGKCITANFFCSMSLLKKHGGFNQKLKSGGDVELSTRVVDGGGRILYSDGALVKHPSRNKYELIVKRKRIIGGTWDSQLFEGNFLVKLGFCWRLLKMLLGRSKKVLVKSSLPVMRRLNLVALLVTIFTTSIVELVKLMFGKETNRS
ncbi:glycosyltransferase family 2 protein [Alteromonas stellipolaris]|uniref:glycosyltransferase n=1 Tax=Alteromonas stellipolaris TaxID=233316 RepID=UPI002118EB8C|nr:glycosyltransferase family 2 protein [Alteromonas stellipolaris]